MSIRTFTRNSSRFTLILLIFISILLLFVSDDERKAAAVGLPRIIAAPFIKGTAESISFIDRLTSDINNYRELEKENSVLREKLKAYELSSENVQAVIYENERLKEILQIKDNSENHFIAARIISKEPGNIFSFYQIDKGTRDGIEQDMVVTASENGQMGMVGRISFASQTLSEVMPILNSKSYIPARVMRTRDDGLIYGSSTSYGFLKMDYVNKGALNEIVVGDYIVTSGLSRIFPPGILIGRVDTVDDFSYNMSLDIKVEPIVNLSRLEYVIVIAREERDVGF